MDALISRLRLVAQYVQDSVRKDFGLRAALDTRAIRTWADDRGEDICDLGKVQHLISRMAIYADGNQRWHGAAWGNDKIMRRAFLMMVSSLRYPISSMAMTLIECSRDSSSTIGDTEPSFWVSTQQPTVKSREDCQDVAGPSSDDPRSKAFEQLNG